MKKSKFVKAIAAFTMSAVAAAGCISLVACGGHSHRTSKDGWQGSNADQHWHVCDEDDTEYGHQDHVWDSTGDVCSECGYDKSSGEGPGPGPGPEVTDDSVVIYENDFTEDATVEFVEEAPEKGVYGMLTNSYADNEDAATNLTVSISEGKLNLKDKGPGTVNAYVKIDEPVELKKVTVYAEVIPGSSNGGWTLLTLLDAAGKPIAYIRTNSDKKAGLCLNGSDVIGTTVDCTANSAIKIEAVLDLAAGTISVSLNEGTASTGTITATSFSGVSLMTANGSKATDERNISLDKIVVKAGSTSLNAEGLKTKLTEKYNGMGVETNYTTNGADLTKAYEDGIAAIDAAADQQAAVKAFGEACEALEAVESDAQLAAKQAAYEKAKADAIAELNAYKGGAANYNEAGEGGNKTAYEAAITAATKAINDVELNGNLEAAKSAIGEALANGKTAIDGISDNATLRAAARAAAKTEIEGYKADEIAEITNTTVAAAIAKVKTEFPAKVDAAVTLTNIKAAVTAAKNSIDGHIDSLHLTLADHKTDKENDLDDYVTAIKADLDETADATLIQSIDGIVSKAKEDIEAVTAADETAEAEAEAKTEVSGIYDKAVSDIDDAIAAYDLAKKKAAAKAGLITYANEHTAPINQDQDLVDELVAYATGDADLLKLIDDVTTPEDLATAITTCEGKINAKVTALSNHEYTITVMGAEGVTVPKVKYGGKITKPANPANTEDARFVNWYTDGTYKTLFDFENTVIYKDTEIYAGWREADVTITYKVNGEVWKEVSAFSGEAPTLADGEGIIVSGQKFAYWYLEGGEDTEYTPVELGENEDITLVAKLTNKTNADLALEENWAATSDFAMKDGIITDSKLLKVTSIDAYAPKAASADFGNGKTFTQSLYSNNIGAGADNSENPVKITAKEDITLKAYVGVGDSSFGGRAYVALYYVLNDGAATLIAENDTSTKVSLKGTLEIELKANDVIEIYATVGSASTGSRMWLFGVDAKISEEFTNATIKTVVDGVETELPWNSLKAVTAPTAPTVEGKSFQHWSLTDGGAKYTEFGTKMLEPGEELKLYAVFATADVTVTFYDLVNGEYVVAGSTNKVSASETIAESDAPAETATEGLQRIGWFTKSDDKYTEYTFGTDLTENSTVELYARYGATIATSGYEEFDTVKAPGTISSKATSDTLYNTNGKITYKGERTPTKEITTAISQGTKNGYTYGPYAAGTNAISTTSNFNNSHYIALNLVEGKSYRVFIVWEVTGTTARHCAVRNDFTKPSDTDVTGAKKSDGIQVYKTEVTVDKDENYYVGFDNKDILIYEIKVEELVTEYKPVTGVSGTVEKTEGDAIDLTKLFFNYEGGTVALDTLGDDVVVTEEGEGVKIVYKGKAVYTYAPTAAE